MQQQQLISYAVTAVVVVALLAFRLRRMSQLRRLRLETLWVVPAIYLIFAGVLFLGFLAAPSLTSGSGGLFAGNADLLLAQAIDRKSVV